MFVRDFMKFNEKFTEQVGISQQYPVAHFEPLLNLHVFSQQRLEHSWKYRTKTNNLQNSAYRTILQ